jgi:hypothetical protein
MARNVNTKEENPKRRRKLGKRKRGEGKMRGKERGERGKLRKVVGRLGLDLDHQRGRGGNRESLEGMSRGLEILQDERKGWHLDLDHEMIDAIGNVLDIVKMRGKTDHAHDLATIGVSVIARHTGTIEMNVNHPDQEVIETWTNDQEHVSKGVHLPELDRQFIVIGTTNLAQDPGMIGTIATDDQLGTAGMEERTGHVVMDMEIGRNDLVLRNLLQGKNSIRGVQ